MANRRVRLFRRSVEVQAQRPPVWNVYIEYDTPRKIHIDPLLTNYLVAKSHSKVGGA